MTFENFINSISFLSKYRKATYKECIELSNGMAKINTVTRINYKLLTNAANASAIAMKSFQKNCHRFLPTEEMKCYVITVSKTFPQTHPRAGDNTHFIGQMQNHIKIHTIRLNYEYWKNRIEEIQKGKAYLSVRMWTGKPYRSDQKEIFKYTWNVGIEKLEKKRFAWFVNGSIKFFFTKRLARNDGLSLIDFENWFGKFQSEPMAIIHFTLFRYSKQTKKINDANDSLLKIDLSIDTSNARKQFRILKWKTRKVKIKLKFIKIFNLFFTLLKSKLWQKVKKTLKTKN